MSPDRRAVLKGIGAVAVVGGGGVAAWRVLGDDGADGGSTATTPRPPDPASSLGDALAALGGRYLEQHPAEADQAVLLAALPALNGRVPERPGQALATLAAQAAGDHESGEVVVVDGWVLSRTECRAAALYAL